MLEWHAINSATYYSASSSSLNNDYLYFLTDTGEIYKGSTKFNAAMELLTAPEYTLPTNPARNRIYINPVTLQGQAYIGSNWVTVIKGVATTVTAGDNDNTVTGGAVATYVAEKIAEVVGGGGVVSSVAYNSTGVTLTITDGAGKDTPLQLIGLATELAYERTNGKDVITLKDITGTSLGAVSLDLERFVESARYEPGDKKIYITFNDTTTIDFYVGDLVDTYTAASSNSISLTVSNNQFTAEAIVAATGGNMLQDTESGLYVAATDLSGCQKIISGATENNVVIVNAAGEVIDSGKSIGGSTLPATGALATVLATELAVRAAITDAITSLTTLINGKIAKIAGGTAGHVVAVAADGEVADSGKSIGGATIAADPTANVLATEAAVAAYVTAAGADALRTGDKATAVTADATDATVPTTKAVAESLSWKTTL